MRALTTVLINLHSLPCRILCIIQVDEGVLPSALLANKHVRQDLVHGNTPMLTQHAQV